MIVAPPIDLMDGKVVRLVRSDPAHPKPYSDDVVAVLRMWQDEGAPLIHVTDLNSALEVGSNMATIQEMLKVASVPIQVMGGIRRKELAKEMLKIGVHRVVMGTLPFKDPVALVDLVDTYGPERIMVALDYTHGKVMIQGWRAAVPITMVAALERFTNLGVRMFMLTAIDRDGTLLGPDLRTIGKACKVRDAVIYASGGIAALGQIEDLKGLGVQGVVIGKALYEGIFSLKQALKVAQEAQITGS